MKRISLLNRIADAGTARFDPAVYTVGPDLEAPDAVMVRSANLLDRDFNPELLAIARAGAGVNNIPLDRCTDRGIVVFNTPGANANGVKELALCALLLASRDIADGIAWVRTLAGDPDVARLVEKGKARFAGCELLGKTLGVIGLGAIGGMVANIAVHLGMNVIGCDPFLSVEGAWKLNHHVRRAADYGEIYRHADYITLHAPASADTRDMIRQDSLAQMKDGVRIVNLSRDSLVRTEDMVGALASGKVARYVTDFAVPALIGVPGAILIPHLGASTAESEENCAVMAAMELDAYLRDGVIRNSVNFPSVSIPRSGDVRVCVLHRNVPGIISRLSGAMSGEGWNIENMTNKSRGNAAYSLFDVTGAERDVIVGKLARSEDILRVRVI